MELSSIDNLQYPPVKAQDFSITGCFSRSGKLHDGLRRQALELPIVNKVHSRNGTSENREGRQAVLAKDGRSASFIVIFKKTHRARLELPIGFEVQINVPDKPLAQAVIKPLVISKVEP